MQDFTILSFSSHSVDNLKAFVQQYLDGELEIYVKSEPIPEDNSGPVKVCVLFLLGVSCTKYHTHSCCKSDYFWNQFVFVSCGELFFFPRLLLERTLPIS